MCEHTTTLVIIETKNMTETIEACIIVDSIRKRWRLTWKNCAGVEVARLGMTVKVMWWIFIVDLRSSPIFTEWTFVS